MRKRQRRDNTDGFFSGRDGNRATKAMMDGSPYKDGRWRQREEKCCFLCGSNTHIKKDCPLSKSLESSPTTYQRSPASERDKDSPQQDRRKKRKAKRMILGPEAGSLANRHASLSASMENWSPFKWKLWSTGWSGTLLWSTAWVQYYPEPQLEHLDECAFYRCLIFSSVFSNCGRTWCFSFYLFLFF